MCVCSHINFGLYDLVPVLQASAGNVAQYAHKDKSSPTGDSLKGLPRIPFRAYVNFANFCMRSQAAALQYARPDLKATRVPIPSTHTPRTNTVVRKYILQVKVHESYSTPTLVSHSD